MTCHGASGRRARSRNDGAIFVEAILVIPILGMLLATVLAVSAIYSTKLEAKARSRRLAWLQAESGRCPERACLGAACGVAVADVRANGVDALSSVRASRFSLDTFVGDVRQFFVGTSTTSVATATKALPMMLGRATRQSGAHPLACNTTPRSTNPGTSAVDLVCQTDLRRSEYAGDICD